MTIDRDSSSTTSGNLNSVLHPLESTVISVCERENEFYMETSTDLNKLFEALTNRFT